ncbi:Hypothetical_protein [Hexamita inflata]|uniref:Hypothetical_protein n=1 Tax=Hexamita inflata TaxID=28002 RepID=A0AA86TUG0_9EUKA|nr:Hypothetical protein HINF_LOCUS11834 [Hexamita inflata]CAI9929141.1 Hypothetical protein HINF_LOCUS16786 [Hexamita inflata]CAI9929144.1 Hypothetical protein HINF_LOCUS16789 [Hexamita inflata]CAI9929146.1 Hypothetical protein HINF_LOCUS16791 [Hexamita inflata]
MQVIYTYIHILLTRDSSNRHHCDFRKRNIGSHTPVPTFKTDSTRHVCSLGQDPAQYSLSFQRTSFADLQTIFSETDSRVLDSVHSLFSSSCTKIVFVKQHCYVFINL